MIGAFFLVSDTGIHGIERKSEISQQEVKTYDLPITSLDALPLKYRPLNLVHMTNILHTDTARLWMSMSGIYMYM